MPAGTNTFVLSVMIGIIIGGVNAYFRYEQAGRVAAARTFLGWLLAFVITGIIATPVANWLLHNVL